MPTIKFWKPYRVLTQFNPDEEGRETLADYIKLPDVYAAGRLDYDSEGLMILTDDGKLNHILTHPKHGHPRTYWVQVEHIPDDAALEKLRRGDIAIKDYKTKPALVRPIEAPELPERKPPIRYRKEIPDCWLEITLTEGKNRQVRRMTAAVGHPTLRLVRAAIGEITLDGLKEGQWKELTKLELKKLWQTVKKTKK